MTGFLALAYDGTNEGLVPRKYVVESEAGKRLAAAADALMNRESLIMRKIREAVEAKSTPAFLERMYGAPDRVVEHRERYLRGELKPLIDPEQFREAMGLPEGWTP